MPSDFTETHTILEKVQIQVRMELFEERIKFRGLSYVGCTTVAIQNNLQALHLKLRKCQKRIHP